MLINSSLRRYHIHKDKNQQHNTYDYPVPAEKAESVLLQKTDENFIASMATIKATALPISKVLRLLVSSSSGLSWYISHRLFTEAASMVGTARKKENSAASLRESFCCIPPNDSCRAAAQPG